MWQFWLLLAGFFLIVEIISVGFLVFWFAVGALITMIVSLFCSNIIVQATVFLIASVILLFATRPFVEKVCKKECTDPLYQKKTFCKEKENRIPG